MRRQSIAALLFFTLVTGPLFGQSRPPARKAAPPRTAAPPATDTLFQQIARLDAKMFAAFNAKDVDQLMAFYAPDMEFYHDTGGLSNFDQTRQGFVRLFANVPDLTRTLVPGSTEVYPVKDYGAIQVGSHRFCHQENGKADCGTFKFLLVWQRQAGQWRVTRVMSYGH